MARIPAIPQKVAFDCHNAMSYEVKFREQLKIEGPENWPSDRVKRSPTSVLRARFISPRLVPFHNNTTTTIVSQHGQSQLGTGTRIP
jgi:hypothetical protein